MSDIPIFKEGDTKGLIPARARIRYKNVGSKELTRDLFLFTSSFMKKLESLAWYQEAVKSLHKLAAKIGGRLKSPFSEQFSRELILLEARVHSLLLGELVTAKSSGARFLADLAASDADCASRAFYKYYASVNYELRSLVSGAKLSRGERILQVVDYCIYCATQDGKFEWLFREYCIAAKSLAKEPGKAVAMPQMGADVIRRLEESKIKIDADIAETAPKWCKEKILRAAPKGVKKAGGAIKTIKAVFGFLWKRIFKR